MIYKTIKKYHIRSALMLYIAYQNIYYIYENSSNTEILGNMT
jgi:predicted transcriptional regulator